VELRINNSDVVFGVGTDGNIVAAAMKAILAGLNRHARNAV
jgi:2-isopropylmalate synthase